MKINSIQHIFRATVLAALISSSMHSFAQPTDEVVAIVDSSVILKSDLEQGIAETEHQLKAQNKTDVFNVTRLERKRSWIQKL